MDLNFQKFHILERTMRKQWLQKGIKTTLDSLTMRNNSYNNSNNNKNTDLAFLSTDIPNLKKKKKSFHSACLRGIHRLVSLETLRLKSCQKVT